ncbi:MAG: SelB C-terminal domain-containing protein, partial [Myxococcales bacterium]|nr:SelB C-terminal domain-containing protein [Myxococcales bacterium]
RGFARIVLDKPTFLLPDDRFVLRDFTHHRDHGRTIAGGRVLAIDGRRIRPAAAALESLSRLTSAEPSTRLVESVRRCQSKGIHAGQLAFLHSLSTSDARQIADEQTQAGHLVVSDAVDSPLYLHVDVISQLESSVLRQLEAHHRESPEELGLPKESLRTRVPGVSSIVLELAIRRLEGRGLISRDETRVATQRVAGEAEKRRRSPLYRELAERLRQSGATPPKLEELARAVGQSAAKVQGTLRLLIQDGVITRVSDDFHYHNDYLADLELRLRDHLAAKTEITASELKELTGASRKYTIPLGEYFDNRRVTIRVGDVRRLRGEK